MSDSSECGTLDTAISPVPDDTQLDLDARISELLVREQTLLKEKQALEKDFGLKRAKLKELYLQREEELKQEKEKTAKLLEDKKQIQSQNEQLKGELDSIKAAVAFSESNKQDTIDSIQRSAKQEIETLQSLMKDVADEASRSTALQYLKEREKLQELNEKYEAELQELRNKLYSNNQDSGEGFLTSVAKQLKLVSVGQHPSPPVSTVPISLEMEHENLEESMKKAQADAEILKSVVMPLEEEVRLLKDKLKEAHEKVHELEFQHASREDSPLVLKQSTPDTQSLPDMDQYRDPEERIKELLHYLQIEKASRKDLEMFVAVQSTQIGVIQEDADKLRAELQEVCNILEEERRAKEDLKQTWEMANNKFLESQRLNMMDMRRMESVLSVEQQRQIAELQNKDKEREAQKKKIQELEEASSRQVREQEERRKLEITRKSEQMPVSELENSFSSLNVTLNDSLLDSTQEGDSFLESKMQELRPDLDGIRVQISPEKTLNLPSLSEAQKKAITDPTPDFEARQTLLASAKSRSDKSGSMQGRLVVSQKEWDLMQQQLREAREKLGRPCDMCNNYEAQLQSVQDEFKKTQVQVKSLDRQLTSEKQVLENQKKYVEDLETTLKTSAEDANKQISSLVSQVQQCEKYITDVRQQYTQSTLEMRDQLKMLTESREQVHKELTRLQNENDSLVGKHSKTSQNMQNEDINLPSTLDEMQLLLLKYREEIIQAKVAKEHIEESLKGEIMFLKDQLLGEQHEKANMEETMSQDIQSLQTKLVVQESLQSELERESKVRSEVQEKLQEKDQILQRIQEKTKILTSSLQQKLDDIGKAKAKLEADNQHLRSKVSSLQVELDNSEAVQRDFVKLSQSLQIQLEKIRQAENEVRWQHEEDTEECGNCKMGFSVTKRKHHCRHCGRIFCSDCVSKTVNSGPNLRPSRVCDICHTILVKDAMPYFSSEPPNLGT